VVCSQVADDGDLLIAPSIKQVRIGSLSAARFEIGLDIIISWLTPHKTD
jgi:hypothetical protein